MDHKDYLRMSEDAALSAHVGACVAAILADLGCATLSQAQRRIYKDTTCGAHLGWRLADGSCLWNGQAAENDPATAAQVVDICVGSIIEGSDSHVPPRWLNIPEMASPDGPSPGFETPEQAVAAFWEIVEGVDRDACDIFDEEHSA